MPPLENGLWALVVNNHVDEACARAGPPDTAQDRSQAQVLFRTMKRWKSKRLTISRVRAPVRAIKSVILHRQAATAGDALDNGRAAVGLAQQRLCTIAILNVGGMHGDAQQQVELVDVDVMLAPDVVTSGSRLTMACLGAPFERCLTVEKARRDIAAGDDGFRKHR